MGLAVTVAPVVALRPVAGAQVYVLAPDAVMVFDEPAHMAPVGLTDVVTVGRAFTVTVVVTLLPAKLASAVPA